MQIIDDDLMDWNGLKERDTRAIELLWGFCWEL